MEVDSLLTGKRGVSLPFTDYCEPIAADAAQFREMFAAAVAFGKKQHWKISGVKGRESLFPERRTVRMLLRPYPRSARNRARAQKLFADLRDSTRRNIKKAEKENITDSHLHLARCHEGIPPPERDHPERPRPAPPAPPFLSMRIRPHPVQGPGVYRPRLFPGTAIAANVYFCFGDHVIYKYGASDRAYQHLRANNLVMWEAIKWGCDHGYKTLCFGRTEPENEGLRQFKAGWGAREQLIKYYRTTCGRTSSSKHPPLSNLSIRDYSASSRCRS